MNTKKGTVLKTLGRIFMAYAIISGFALFVISMALMSCLSVISENICYVCCIVLIAILLAVVLWTIWYWLTKEC